ncbi:MAG: peptidoglycan synthetase, partial [Sphingobacteriales bacterium]
IDRRPKFHLYKANVAVISGIAWDHINVFPTYADYTAQFDKFIDTIEAGGTLIYCEADADLTEIVQKSEAGIKKIGYAIPEHEIRSGITYLLPEKTALKIFGDHNLMNMNAAKLVCEQLNISSAQFNEAIASFTGAAKRLEVISADELTNVYKDFAHSPSKLKATIDAVKAQFTDRKLVACIELHTFSSLNKDFLKEYAGAMDKADEAIVFIDLKSFEQKRMEPFSEQDVQDAFSNPDLKFFNDAFELKRYLLSLNYKNSNLLMMSSGNYAGFDLPELAASLTR